MGRVLQVSGGKRERDYHGWFIDHDVAAIGPGGLGPWDPNEAGNYVGNGKSALKAFYEAEIDQVVVLTVGLQVKAVGLVKERADYKKDMRLFGNWDLFHVARVVWSTPGNPLVDRLLLEAPKYKGQIKPRACWLGGGNAELSAWASSAVDVLQSEGHLGKESLVDLDFEDKAIDADQWRKSVPTEVQNEVIEIVDRSKELWRAIESRKWSPPASENEIVALIVVPFLIALGWQPSNLALEWHPWGRFRADVAGFSTENRIREDCRLLVEAKTPGKGLVFAKGQVFSYANGDGGDPGIDAPILTTDGFSWVLYESAGAVNSCGEVFMPDVRESALEFFENIQIAMPRS